MAHRHKNLSVFDQDVIYRELFDGSSDGILIIKEGQIILFNKASISLLGFEPNYNLTGKNILEISQELQQEGVKSINKVKESIDLCIKNGKYRFEWQHSTPKGTKVFFDVALIVIKTKRDCLIQYTFRDINEYKKIQFELHEREEMFRIAFDDAPSGMSIIAPKDFSYIAVNPLLCKMFGYTKEELMSKSIKLVTHPDDEERSNEWIRCKYNDLPCDPFIEKRYIHKDGNIVWGLVSSEWIKNDDGSKRMAITHILDITQIKLAEQELIKHRDNLEILVNERTKELLTSNEELQAINEELYNQRRRLEKAMEDLKSTQEQLIESEKMASLGILAAGVAHEINNPINFISNGVAIIEIYLQKDHPDTKQKLQHLFDAINLGIKRSTEIVKSLGKYSRSEDYPFTDCNVHEIIDNCLTMLFNQYKNRIEIVKEYNPLLPSIHANEGQLHQVFLNILVNSIQAIGNQGKICITTSHLEKSICIIISDNGDGISKENLKKIFDPFFTTKDPSKGVGLGLSITQKIITQHHGTINCESELNKGTKFCINLPLK